MYRNKLKTFSYPPFSAVVYFTCAKCYHKYIIWLSMNCRAATQSSTLFPLSLHVGIVDVESVREIMENRYECDCAAEPVSELYRYVLYFTQQNEVWRQQVMYDLSHRYPTESLVVDAFTIRLEKVSLKCNFHEWNMSKADRLTIILCSLHHSHRTEHTAFKLVGYFYCGKF